MGGHRNLEYGFAANELAFGSSILIALGGVIGVLPYAGFSGGLAFYRIYWASIYALVIGIIISLIEYPRGQRRKGTTVERRFQSWFLRWSVLNVAIARNYYLRAAIYFFISVPCCFLVTTVLGGVVLLISSIVYLVAAIKGEKWESPSSYSVGKDSKAGQKNLKSAPSYAPPRRPENASGAASHDNKS